MATRKKTGKISHVHDFLLIPPKEHEEEATCICGVVGILNRAFNSRVNVWEKRYADTKKSISYTSFLEMQQAYKNGDIATVKRLAQAAHERIAERVVVGSSRPHFGDPRDLVYKGKMVVI